MRVIVAAIFIYTGSLLIPVVAAGQDSLLFLPATTASRYLDGIKGRAAALEGEADKKTEQALRQFQKQEAKLRSKLSKIDSAAAKNIFAGAENKYKELAQKLKDNKLRQYIPQIDSLSTSLKFLEANPQFISQAKEVKEKLKEAMSKMEALKSQLQKAEDIKQFLKERKQYLKEQLSKFGFAKELKKINKQVYYYVQQLNEYKEILKDPKKTEKKVMELLARTKLFKDFMRKNSMLASLFPMPGGNGLSGQSSQSGFSGLQTRAQMTTFLLQNGMSGPNNSSLNQFQENIQNAQGQLNQLRNKLNQFGLGNSGDLEMPDFKPNSLKTKSFFKRLEYGANIQSQKSRSVFPATTDLGLSVAYKLNDKSLIGIGGSYKFGLGKGWNKIKLSSEGVGLRSFIEYKVRNSWWLSGGYEQNYLVAFERIDQLRELSSWQRSGLIGISKSVSLKSKLLKSTKVQLLWDFLSASQKPKTQPIVFRIGYNFN